MKRVLLLTTIGVLFCVAYSQAQNVFNPADPTVRYSSGAALGSPQRPDPSISGLQKWVSVASSGVSTGSNSYDASSFKAYFINNNGGQMAFRLKFPKSYTNPDSAGKKYPVMIFFHGAGEPGCPTNGGVYNNERQLLHGGKLFRDYVDNNQFDGFLFYPQNTVTSGCWGGWGVAPFTHWYDDINKVLDSLGKYVRADVSAVLTTGLSDGGAAAWSMAATYPTRVAKAGPSAAATGATNFGDFVHLPIWFASGGKDSNPTPGFAATTYNSIKNAGADITYTLFPDLGHSVWYQHWQLPGFVGFMNGMHKANPLVFFQRNEFCPDSTIGPKIGISRGFYEYQWRRNGQLIASAVRTGQVQNGNGTFTYTYNSTIEPGGATYITSYTANDITVNSFGTYDVRFRRIQNGDWSPWSPKPAVISQKVITNTPAITLEGFRSKVLPAPDGSTIAPLILPVGYNKYEWYRNDVLVDTGRRFNAIPGAYKAKAYEPFGCGSIFSPVFNVVAANGEPKPDPAINLSATVEDLINIRLKWNQNPNAGENETGFEVYRSTGGAGGPYALLAITGPDASNYLDANRPSNSTFYYIVRAVGNFGAGAVTNEASASTPSDNVAPTAPNNLRATCITRDRVILNWGAASDNVGVAVYDIYINGDKSYSTTKTRFEVYQLNATTQYTFTVKAKDAAGNASQPSNQVAAFTRAQGVCYKLYEGDWEFLPDFNALTPIAEGMVPSVNLNLIPGVPADHFGVLFEGHMLGTTSEDDHRFGLCSDDGARFYFNSYYNPNSNGTFNIDGVHGLDCVNNNTTNFDLNNGQAYPFALAYFDKLNDDSLRLTWQITTSAGAPFDTIPPAAFTQTGGSTTVPAVPGTLTATVFNYKQINLAWGNVTGETGFEIVRATAVAGPFNPLATVAPDVLSYSDTGLNASTQYWYRVRSINVNGGSAFGNTANATTQAPPPGPAAPSNLVASTPALATVQLTWNDNSNNETGFEIWRSAGNNTQFELLTTTAGGAGAQKVFVDAPVFANVHYFYKVRAAGSPTPSGYTGEASASTANTPPILNSVSDFTVKQGTSVTVAINATDVDGDPMQFIAPSLPYFATIQPVSNGNANLVVNPPLGEQGGYTMRLVVDDGFGGKDTVKFTIVVNDNQLPVLNPINDVNVNEGDSVVLNITATDAEMAQYFIWSTNNMPSFGTLTNNGNGSATLKLKPSYGASGLYSMTVKVDDGFGAWTSRTFSIIVNETDPNESIQINMGYFTPPVALWNEVSLQGVTSWNRTNLVNKKGEVTTVGFRSLTTGGGIAGSDHGMQPGGTGVFPEPIMKTQLKVGYGGGSDQMTMEVFGLDPTKKYNFIFFASDNGAEAWRGYNANTITTWSINGNTASIRLWQNINVTDTIYQISPDALGRVTITQTGDPSPNIGAILNALVVEKQFDDNTTPAKPANLQAQVIPNQGVNLQWEDVAYNENSYRVFRSTSLAGPYTALTPDAQRDSVHFVDQILSPYTQYYYFVRGVNHLGMGTPSDTVGAVTGNNKPNFNSLGDLIVKTGATTQDDFSVSDDAGDVLTVSIKNKPSYITLTSLGGNNYRITASPTIDNIGWDYVTVEVKDDKDGVRTQDVVVTVADAATRSVYINFAYNVPAPAPWNNIMGFGNIGTTVNNLRDETNAVTPFGINYQTGWDGVFENGQRTGNNSGVFPDSVIAAGLFDDGSTNMVIRFTGLNPAMRYNIALMGSLNDGRLSWARYSCNGVADSLLARNNSNGTANLNNLTPSAGGILDVTIQKLTGSIWTVLNGVQIEEYAPPAGTFVMKPLNLYVEARMMGVGAGNTSTSVSLTWSDRSSNETGFRIERSTDSTFNTGVSGNDVNTPGLSFRSNTGVLANLTANTRYWFRVRAYNATGNSEWSNKVKVITPQTSVNINFNFSVADETNGWNNTNALPNFLNTFAGLINHQNAPTSMIMAIEKIFNGEYAFGLRPSGGVVPANVMEASYWIDRSQEAQIRLSGLNQDKRYRIGFTGGIDDALFTGEFTMSYTVNGRTVVLNSFFNEQKMVWIGDITPSESGEIVIVFSTPNRNTIVYGFTSAIVVQSYDDPIGGQSPNVVRVIDQPEVVLQSPTDQPTVSVSTAAAYDARMYPNPFTDQINLDFNNNSAGNNIAVDVYDLSGKLVFRRNYGRLPAGYNTVRLNTAEGQLNTGVYLVTLNVNGKPVQTTKMIKDRK